MSPNQAQSRLLWIEKANLLTLITGIVLSAYGLFVELKHEHNSSYQAMCDVSETISCTKAFSSSWATGLGLVEPLLGKDHFLNQVIILNLERILFFGGKFENLKFIQVWDIFGFSFL